MFHYWLRWLGDSANFPAFSPSSFYYLFIYLFEHSTRFYLYSAVATLKEQRNFFLSRGHICGSFAIVQLADIIKPLNEYKRGCQIFLGLQFRKRSL